MVHIKNPLIPIPRRSGPFDLKNFNPPSFVLSLCPLLLCCHFYWCKSCINFVTQLALSLSLSLFVCLCGSSDLLPLLSCFLIPPHFISAIAFTCSHPIGFYFSMSMLSTSIPFSSLSSPRHLYLAVFTSSHTLTPPQHVISFPLYMWRHLLSLGISFTTPHVPPIVHWTASLLRPSLLAPTLLSPLLSLSLSR